MAIPMIPGIIGLLAALTGAGATNFAMGARPASTIGGPSGQGAMRPTSPTVQGSRSPDTSYADVRAISDMIAPPTAPAPTPIPRSAPKTAPKTTKRAPAKQTIKAPTPQGSLTAPTAQEDPFTQAQRMVNGTEQVPAEVMAPVSDPVEDRYQLLLKMYGITPDNTAAPNGMPDTMARQAGLNTGATSGVFNPEAALQYYGGDQAVYDALARMYRW